MAKDLTSIELDYYATKVANNEDIPVKRDDLSDMSRRELGRLIDKKIEERKEQREEMDRQNAYIHTDAEPLESGPVQLPGGITVPEGSMHVGTITADQQTNSDRFNVAELEEYTKMNVHSHNVSCTLNVSPNDPTVGYIEGRIIHDGGAQAYVFRKDEFNREENRWETIFDCFFSTQGVPIV